MEEWAGAHLREAGYAEGSGGNIGSLRLSQLLQADVHVTQLANETIPGCLGGPVRRAVAEVLFFSRRQCCICEPHTKVWWVSSNNRCAPPERYTYVYILDSWTCGVSDGKGIINLPLVVTIVPSGWRDASWR